MKSLILIFLLTLWISPLYSLPSTPAKDEWPLCFSESEWANLETQVWAETELTVKEAVDAAVIPYKAKIGELARQIKGLRTTLVVTVSISAVCLGGWVLMSVLK